MAYTINDFTSISLKYDPDGNRIFKDSSQSSQRKYIVDIVGDLPVILMELNNSGGIVKTYIYANSQIIAQHDGDHNAERYFYMHDRLGSVRQIIDDAGAVVNCYTYDPWGMPVGDETQTKETISNMYLFAGYVWDAEISQYHCFRRQYDPVLARFTSRDPVQGNFKEPMTLHAYLYCFNDPINGTDPTGEFMTGLRFNYRVIWGINMYYNLLNMALGGTYPEGMVESVLAVNTWREIYFDQENLIKPFAWEIAMQEFMQDMGNNMKDRINNMLEACEWTDLGNCLSPVITKWAAETLAKEVTGYSALGKATCAACVLEPTKLTCILCAGYAIETIASNTNTANDVWGCFSTHCGD